MRRDINALKVKLLVPDTPSGGDCEQLVFLDKILHVQNGLFTLVWIKVVRQSDEVAKDTLSGLYVIFIYH